MARSTKAASITMTYYEKLVKKINESMDANPRSALVMDLGSLEIVAKGSDFKAIGKKLNGLQKPSKNPQTVVFKKSNQKAAWIL